MILSFTKFSQSNHFRFQHFSIHPFFYGLYGIYLLLMHAYLSYQQILRFNSSISSDSNFSNSTSSSLHHHDDDHDHDNDETHTMRRHEFSYLFYNGRWSLADAMVYVLFCFNTTLRFGQSASISGFYILSFTILPFLLHYPFHPSTSPTTTSSSSDSTSSFVGYEYSLLLTPSIFIIFTFYLLCLVSSQDIEMKLRYRFLKLSELGHALRRRDTLINSILPKEISVALRKGDTMKLSAYYQNVTILFCSIVDFGRHSSISHAEVSCHSSPPPSPPTSLPSFSLPPRPPVPLLSPPPPHSPDPPPYPSSAGYRPPSDSDRVNV
jgi:hypothetical protein